MRIDDPGWGDHVPLPEEQGKESAGQTGGSPPTSGPPSKPPGAPWWRSRSGIAVLAVVVVAVIVAVAAAGRGGDPPPPPTTEASSGTGGSGGTAGSSSTGGTAAPLPSRDDQYLANANAICANRQQLYVGWYNNYVQTSNPTGLIQFLQALQAELGALGDPVAGADTYLSDLDLWTRTLQEGDLSGAGIIETGARTHAREAGLQNCPPY
jgi:hypothetical protein